MANGDRLLIESRNVMSGPINGPTWSKPICIDNPENDRVTLFIEVTAPRAQNVLVSLYGSFDGESFEEMSEPKLKMSRVVSPTGVTFPDVKYSYLKVLCTPVDPHTTVEIRAQFWKEKPFLEQEQWQS